MVRRILAIFIKETQDIATNFNVSILFALPLIFAVIFKRLGNAMDAPAIASTSVLLLAGMAGIYVPSMLVAEEREKRTLQVLMLSPATPAEVFIGKGLMTLVMTLLFALITYILAGVPAARIPVLLLFFALGVAACIPLGMIVGLFAPNVLSTGLVGMPLYLAFILLPPFTMFNETLKQVGRVLPTTHLYYVTIVEAGPGARASWLLETAGILLLMCAVACLLLTWVYRRRATALG